MVRAELGRDQEDAGLKRVKDIPSSNIQLLWLLLHYGVIKVQPVDRHLQSASWLHKLYNDFLLLLGYFISLNKQCVVIKPICQKLTAMTCGFKGSLAQLYRLSLSFFHVLRAAQFSTQRQLLSLTLCLPGIMKHPTSLMSTLLTRRQFLAHEQE